MEIFLKNVLWICLIVLVIAVLYAVVQVILILIDLRRTSKNVKDFVSEVTCKMKNITSFLDIAALISNGVALNFIKDASKKSNFIAFIAGVKKGIKVFFGGEKE